MIQQSLVEGIKKHLSQGDSKETIHDFVLSAGHSEADFDIAYNMACSEAEHSYIPLATSVSSASTDTNVKSVNAVELSYSDNKTVADPAEPLLTHTGLPTIGLLFKESFSFLLERKAFFFYVFLVQAVVIFFNVGIIENILPRLIDTWNLFGMALAGVSVVFLGFLAYFNLGALMYVVILKSSATYKESLQWAYKNFWSYAWIYILYTFVISGGFILFIVPGLYVAIVLSLALPVFIHEDLRGMNALVRSRQLMKDKELGVFARLLVFLIVGTGLNILASVLSVWFTELQSIIMAVSSVLVSVLIFSVMGSLYRALLAGKPSFVPESKTKYTVLAWFGFLLMFIIPVMVLTSLSIARDKTEEVGSFSEVDIDQNQMKRLEHNPVPAGWVKYVSMEDDFSVAFPSEPVEDSTLKVSIPDNPQMTYDRYSYVSINGSEIFTVFKDVYPVDFFDKINPKDWFEKEFKSSGSAVESNIISSVHTMSSGYPAFAFSVKEKQGDITEGAFILVDDTVYALMSSHIATQSGIYDEDLHKQFINSFELR